MLNRIHSIIIPGSKISSFVYLVEHNRFLTILIILFVSILVYISSTSTLMNTYLSRISVLLMICQALFIFLTSSRSSVFSDVCLPVRAYLYISYLTLIVVIINFVLIYVVLCLLDSVLGIF